MKIFVDADACPVVRIVEKIAEKYEVPVTLLCDTNHALSSDYSEVIVVGAGADAVDFKLISLCHQGDIVVIQDIGEAAMALGKKDFYIDLLFYNTKLRCYVAIDLKTGEFKPEQAGKMNFYLSALDDLVKSPDDNPSVGLILYRDENRTIAEYALRDMSKPIGVSEYHLLYRFAFKFEKYLTGCRRD